MRAHNHNSSFHKQPSRHTFTLKITCQGLLTICSVGSHAPTVKHPRVVSSTLTMSGQHLLSATSWRLGLDSSSRSEGGAAKADDA